MTCKTIFRVNDIRSIIGREFGICVFGLVERNIQGFDGCLYHVEYRGPHEFSLKSLTDLLSITGPKKIPLHQMLSEAYEDYFFTVQEVDPQENSLVLITQQPLIKYDFALCKETGQLEQNLTLQTKPKDALEKECVLYVRSRNTRRFIPELVK